MIEKLRYIFSRKEKIRLVMLLVLIVIGSALELIGVAAFVPFITVLMDTDTMLDYESVRLLYNLLQPETMTQFITILALGLCLVYIVKNAYLSFMQNAILSFTYRNRMNIATRLLTAYMSEPYTFHLNRNVAEMQRSLQTDTTQFMLLVNCSLQMIAEVVTCAALGVYLFSTSHTIAVIIGGLLVVCVLILFYLSKKVSLRIGQQNQVYNAQLLQWINQSLGGIKEVKILEREGFFIGSYNTIYRKLIRGAKNNEMLATIPKYLVETVCMCGMLLAVIFKLYYGHGALTTFIPQLSAFAVAAIRLLPSVGKMNSYISNILYYRPSLDLIYHDLKEVDGNVPDWKTKVVPEEKPFEDGIRVEGVVYRYPNTDVNVLDGVDLFIPKGSTVALIGSSGAGKTTLADVILGLLPPQSGCVKVDDWDIYESLPSWHRLLGYIPQTIYLSDDTIRNNVAFGVPKEEIDDETVISALKEAQLYDFVMGLPEGWDTFVGDRGVRISGGQRQRIGIARALYHNPEVLVLDEATSALDNETEQAVMESIERLQGHKTILIIAHRLSTIRKADRIYEVHDGVLEERDREEVFAGD